MLIGGEWRDASETYDVTDPYRKTVIARAPRSTLADLDAALKAAVAAKPVMAAMPGYERAALLRRVKALLLQRADAIAETMSRETGKAIKDARGEVVRKDDNPEVFKTRLEAYKAQTAPLSAYYERKGTLKTVDGMRPIDEVTEALKSLLGR